MPGGIRLNDAEHLHYAEVSGLGTHDHRPYSRIEYREFDISEGPGCFVATAVYGSRTCREVVILRRFRDERLVRSRVGRRLIAWYYRFGPRMAASLRKRPAISRAAKMALDWVVCLLAWVLDEENCQERR